MKYIFTIVIALLLHSCGGEEVSDLQEVPDAEKALKDPWFYIGTWKHTDTTGAFQWATIKFSWDSRGRLASKRERLLNSGKLSVKSATHEQTLDFLRDKIYYVNDSNLRYAYKSINTVFTRVTPKAKTPEIFVNKACSKSLVGSCDFYNKCVEKTVSCGSKGYALSYGRKYCDKFSRANFISSETDKWMTSTKKCLQKELLTYFTNEPNKSQYQCSKVNRAAFDSHPRCYTQKPNSICLLPIEDLRSVADILQVLAITAEDLITIDSLIQIEAVAGICSNQVADELRGETDKKRRAQLLEKQKYWSSLK